MTHSHRAKIHEVMDKFYKAYENKYIDVHVASSIANLHLWHYEVNWKINTTQLDKRFYEFEVSLEGEHILTLRIPDGKLNYQEFLNHNNKPKSITETLNHTTILNMPPRKKIMRYVQVPYEDIVSILNNDDEVIKRWSGQLKSWAEKGIVS